MSGRFESVVGLEVHVQLATATKLFCGCRNQYGAEPNTRICAVCAGHPGTLPVLNEQALRLAVVGGLALHCSIAERAAFERKNYFYPDLPKGYQISQFARPINAAGWLDVAGDDGTTRRVQIVRAHLEEDAGKSMHPPGAPHSLLDLNRAGVPLLEIVTAPDLRSPKEASRYLEELKRRLRYARVSECDMEKGSLRCDANVSVRAAGSEALNERVEVKNLNSFKNVARAIEHEIARQVAVMQAGGKVERETRSWREDEEKTAVLRGKEEAQDYRYFPEPDLPEFDVPRALVDELISSLPEMPDARRLRYREVLGLKPETVELLVSEREHAVYFERCLAVDRAHPAVLAALFPMVLQEANARGVPLAATNLKPEGLVAVAAWTAVGRLSNQAAKKVLAEISATGDAPEAVIERLGLEQVSDRGDLVRVADEVIAGNPKAASEYRAGKAAALNALVGAVMKATQGKANPNLAREVLEERLKS